MGLSQIFLLEEWPHHMTIHPALKSSLLSFARSPWHTALTLPIEQASQAGLPQAFLLERPSSLKVQGYGVDGNSATPLWW